MDAQSAAGGSTAATPLRYAYKASLIGSAHQFELTDSGLTWQIAGRSGLWRYRDIAAIRLSYRPMSMQSQRFRADLESTDRQRIVILSTSWQSATLMAPQDQNYRAFMAELHRRMREAGSNAMLIGGLGPKTYAAAILLLAMVGLSIAGLLTRAIAIGEFYGALFLIGFAALFGWQIGGFVSRNRPQTYTFASLPETLLP